MKLHFLPCRRARALHAMLFTLVAFVTPTGAALHAQQATEGPHAGPLFTLADAVLLGGFTAATLAVAPLDQRLAERLQHPRVQENRLLGEASAVARNLVAPGSVIIGIGIYTVGRLTRSERVADLGLHGTEALLIGGAVASVMKGVFGRARPYRDETNPRDFKLGRGFLGPGDFRSFPSGHAAAAFAAATAVVSETSRWHSGAAWVIGPLMYGGAAMAGVSRMYNNRHWATDVLAGAAIGTFAGLKVVRWHHAHPDNAVDRFFLAATVTRDGSGAARVRFSLVPEKAAGHH